MSLTKRQKPKITLRQKLVFGAAMMVLPSGVLNAGSPKEVTRSDKQIPATEQTVTQDGPHKKLREKYPNLLGRYVDSTGHVKNSRYKNLPVAIRMMDKRSRTGRSLLQAAENYGVKLKPSNARGAQWNDQDSTLSFSRHDIYSKKMGVLVKNLAHEMAHVWQTQKGLDETIQKDLSATDAYEAMIFAERHATTTALIVAYDCRDESLPNSSYETIWSSLKANKEAGPQFVAFQNAMKSTRSKAKAVEAAWEKWDDPKRAHVTKQYMHQYTRITTVRAGKDEWFTGKKKLKDVIDGYKAFGTDSVFDIANFKTPPYVIDPATKEKRPSTWSSFPAQDKEEFKATLKAIEAANKAKKSQTIKTSMRKANNDGRIVTVLKERSILPGKKAASTCKITKVPLKQKTDQMQR